MEIIVTDLTRFSSGNPNVCIAGIEPASGTCIRPMPYLTLALCKQHHLLPGTKLEGDFASAANISRPHVEDHNYSSLDNKGPCTADEFHDVLLRSMSPSVSQGFVHPTLNGGKVIPTGHPIDQSIITISVAPRNLSIFEDNWGKLKAHVTDSSGTRFSYLSITDFGFFHFAQDHHGDTGSFDGINDFLAEQDEIYLRIGLSRDHTSQQGVSGHWIQVNGIYTFPNIFPDIRTY